MSLQIGNVVTPDDKKPLKDHILISIEEFRGDAVVGKAFYPPSEVGIYHTWFTTLIRIVAEAEYKPLLESLPSTKK